MTSYPEFDFAANLRAGHILAPQGAALVIAEWTAPGCPTGEQAEFIAPLHLHHDDDEAWYILEGTLGFQIGDEQIEASAGDALTAPRGTPHTYWNPRADEARYLIIMTAQIRALIDAIHAMEQRDPESLKLLFERYGAQLLD
ncbi:cupin domain-containing protein [Paenibacillus solisilvae]|uniref:Cupin domain-containing protein n=1 Tax=Paenibacillus solisilvae TaxID=2486751 RepID=A0ABW0VXN6_9BACL